MLRYKSNSFLECDSECLECAYYNIPILKDFRRDLNINQ